MRLWQPTVCVVSMLAASSAVAGLAFQSPMARHVAREHLHGVDLPTLELHNERRKNVNEGRRSGGGGEIPMQDISRALGTNFLGN